jgi:hypothetical protein
MTEPRSTHDKALDINVDAARYGTFAEIGAGQEVARWFFRVGGAAGTVAKTISAYDMSVSDAMYGATRRYVSRERLVAMLDHETRLLLTQLDATRGEKSNFFVFADTVATRSYSRHRDGDGWLGVRFQTRPRESPSEIILHVHLHDREPEHAQEALGVLGVNLVHGAFYLHQDPAALLASLMEGGLARERIEIDMVRFSGPAFGVDNRLMSLWLVENGFTDGAMFTAEGEVVQASEVLYDKAILVERGSFRPITRLTLDLLERAREQFLDEPELRGEEPVVVMEMTLSSLASAQGVDHADFLARVDVLRTLGHHVFISGSRHGRYFDFVELLARYTRRLIGIALGVPSLREITDDRHYTDLAGGVLESAGRLFRNAVKVYVHPYRDPQTGELETAETMRIDPRLRHLHAFLLENRRVESIRGYDPKCLDIRTPEVLAKIQSGDPSWEALVPRPVVDVIKLRRLFGYQPPPSA